MKLIRDKPAPVPENKICLIDQRSLHSRTFLNTKENNPEIFRCILTVLLL